MYLCTCWTDRFITKPVNIVYYKVTCICPPLIIVISVYMCFRSTLNIFLLLKSGNVLNSIASRLSSQQVWHHWKWEVNLSDMISIKLTRWDNPAAERLQTRVWQYWKKNCFVCFQTDQSIQTGFKDQQCSFSSLKVILISEIQGCVFVWKCGRHLLIYC